MLNVLNPISLREFNHETDYGYILQTYTQQLHKVQPLNFIPNSIFFPRYTEKLNSILNHTVPVMAVLEDEPNSIVGYLIAKPVRKDNLVIYWGTTKGIFRRTGVMKDLLSIYDYKNKNIIITEYFDLFKDLKDRYNLILDPKVGE